MPVPGCFDYSGLVIQFDIRYCDPSCFVLLSQNCCTYSGSFMVPYTFLKCLFCICEICHGYSNRDCIESIDCFGYYGHFDDVNSSMLLVGMQTGVAIVENSMEFPQKTKNGTAF